MQVLGTQKEVMSTNIPIDGDFVEGSKVWMRNCASCHTLERDSSARRTAGPALGLVYGRRVGQDL